MTDAATDVLPPRTRAMGASWRWFARTFGIAIIAHLAGNPPTWRTDDFAGSTVLVVVCGLLGLLALALLLRPDRRVLGSAAALVLVSVWFEAPFLSNHWLLVGFVALAVLASLFQRDPWAWLSVSGRWILLAFYSFAAFAKLNTGFLDPVASCGVFYANQSLASFGLPTVPTDNPGTSLMIIGPMLTELSVPILLAFGRTRRIGVLLALCFHTVISIDLDQHFYDFTSVLVVLLCLFLPEDVQARLEAGAGRMSPLKAAAVAVLVLVVVASVLPETQLTTTVLKLLPFLVWVPFAGWLIVTVGRSGLGRSDVPMQMPSLVTAVIVACVVANGLTPYLELKTAYGFNMYANLETVDGESNHLVVRKTFPLTDVQKHLYTVVETEDPLLAQYITARYLVPERNLLDYLARHPSTEVLVRDQDGQERTLTGSDGVRLHGLVSKLMPFRAVDMQDPPRCQAVWLPAR